MSALILVVEDEKDLAATLVYNLEKAGYQTRTARSGADALTALDERTPDLVLLDLMLPDMSGTDICLRIRAGERTRDVPVVMLTAKGEEIDRVVGFEVGADDYVVKPFSVRELLLRLAAVLRRARQSGPPSDAELLGAVRIDRAGHRTWVAGDELSLTALEFRLLSTLLARKGRVQTRGTLLSDVWGIDADVTTRTVDTHIKRLRDKLGVAGSYIETIRGVGYRIRERPVDGT